MGNDFAILKTMASIKILPDVPKTETKPINLRQFINQEYPKVGTVPVGTTLFKCTIRDIGITPYEIDVYDNRMILVKVTGRTVKKNGVDVPERVYVDRDYNMATVLTSLAHRMSREKILGMESQVITMRDYANSFTKFYKYMAGLFGKEYEKALDNLVDNFPFTQISVEPTDEEDWFKSK